MADPNSAALYLRPGEIRRGVELLYFGHGNLLRAIDGQLAADGLGRAHHRALYFIARQGRLTVSDLLRLLGITKQSLGRVLKDLTARNLIESGTPAEDRRMRYLSLTAAGRALEASLFEDLRERLGAAYRAAGPEAVGGFWQVLDAMVSAEQRATLAKARP